MGACILKSQPNIEQLCSRALEFEVDRSRHHKKSVLVWKVTEAGTEVLSWPYKFYSTCSYIVIVVGSVGAPLAMLHRDRTSIQFAEMLFGGQFLLLHLKTQKKLMINDKEYSIVMYSFYGDSILEDLLARARLTFYFDKIEKYLEFGAGYFCLSTINQAEPIPIRDDIKQFVDLDSEQYQQQKTHIFFQQQLFPTQKPLKKKLETHQQTPYFSKFRSGQQKIPFIQISEPAQKKFKRQKKRSQQQIPFACEITQINIKNDKKMIQPNLQESNMIFDQNQNHEVEKIQEILKGLFLGTQKVSRNYPIINDRHIRLIVNCAASTCKNWFINDFSYKWLDIPEVTNTSGEFNIQCLIYQVADIVGSTLSKSQGVLLHCSGYQPKVQQSGNRSAAILIGVIMCHKKIKYEQAYELVTKKWKTKIPLFMQNQLKNIHRRMCEKPKTLQLYSICSYSRNFPSHQVAKYICEIENVSNIQGLDDFAKGVFLCVGASTAKVMVGRECQQKEEDQKYAKEHLRLIAKYEGFTGQCSVEQIDKTFRKQPKIETTQILLHLPKSKDTKNAGYLRNEQIVIKYPILQPVWEKKKDDGFYFTIRERDRGADVIMSKGINWIGLEEDKEQFFDKIVHCYLSHVEHQEIYVSENQEDQSLFDESGFRI